MGCTLEWPRPMGRGQSTEWGACAEMPGGSLAAEERADREGSRGPGGAARAGRGWRRARGWAAGWTGMAGWQAGWQAGWHWARAALGLSQSQSRARCGGRRDKWCQQNCRRNGVAYGMRRGKCRGRGPDLDGDVRSEGLTGSIAGVFLERR